MATNHAIATGKLLDIHQDSFLKIRSPTVSLMTQLRWKQTEPQNSLELIQKARECNKNYMDKAREKRCGLFDFQFKHFRNLRNLNNDTDTPPNRNS